MPEFSPNHPFAGDEDPEWSGFDLKKFVLAAVHTNTFDDDHNHVIEDRLLRIEECVAARWPRRWLLWARLRRELRASVAGFADSYIPRGDFIARRTESCSAQIVATDRERWRHYEAYKEYMARRGAAPLRGDDAPAGDPINLGWRQPDEDRQDGDDDPGAGFLA